MNILQSIGAGIASIGLFIGSLFGFTPEVQTTITDAPVEELGRAVDAVATNNYVIAGSGISSSATTITLSSFTTPVSGVPYTMANFGQGGSAKGYLTIEPGSRTRQEIVSFTGLTQNADGSATLTGVTRGLLPFEPYTASTTYATAHNGGSQVTVSNPPQLYDALYDYIDSAAIAGAVDGTTLAKGIYETATGLEAASTTQIGAGNTTATLVLTTLVSSSTAPTIGNYVPVTQSNGILSGTFCCNGSTTLSASTTVAGFYPVNIVHGIYVASTSGTSTFSVPTGIKKIKVQLVAGGGAGGAGANNGSSGGGGGGGGYSMEYINVSSTSTIVYYVGAAGEQTRFGPAGALFLSATPGSAGTAGASTGAGGAGGVGSGGDIDIAGGGGSGGSYAATAELGDGAGGGSMLGGGGRSTGGAGDVAGAAGGNYGGGGSGGHGASGGGAGAGGVIIIEW